MCGFWGLRGEGMGSCGIDFAGADRAGLVLRWFGFPT